MRKTTSLLISLAAVLCMLLPLCGCNSKKTADAAGICTSFCEDVKAGDADKLMTYFGDAEITSKELKEIICAEEKVYGVYDVTLFNYGPNKNYGSVHVELPDTMSVDEVDRLTRKIQVDVFHKTGIILTGIGVYSFNTTDNEAAHMRNATQKTVMSHDWALLMHGFYADTENKTLRFDVVISFDIDKNNIAYLPQYAEEYLARPYVISKKVMEYFPDYTVKRGEKTIYDVTITQA